MLTPIANRNVPVRGVLLSKHHRRVDTTIKLKRTFNELIAHQKQL
jgi:hypothetical protein